MLSVLAGYAEPEHAFLRIEARQPGWPEPVCARAIIQMSNGEIVEGEWGDAIWPPVSLRGKAVAPGALIEAPLGETVIRVGKGPDFLPVTIRTNLSEAGEVYTIPVELEPQLGLYKRGWRAGDAHIHFFHGDDQISRTPEEAWAICAAGGLNFASFAGEHYGAPTLAREEALGVWEPFADSECQIWLGAEAPKSAWGHHASIVYDPWSIRDALPYGWGIHSVHEQGGVSFPVHPERRFPGRESGGKYGLFPLNNYLKFFPIAALAGHLLDGWSGISDEPDGPGKLDTYFKLLELGYKIPLLADSDFCMDRVNNGVKGMGFWMNYFHLEGSPLTRAAVANAIRKGRVMCTTGPLVLFEIDGALPGDSLPADGSLRTARIQASYRFNPWTLGDRTFDGAAPCRISTIELIRNGEVIQTWTPGEPAAAVEFPVQEEEDAYYMVRVLGNEGVWMAGYASPIYFDKAPRARRPGVFKALVRGRVYDSATGQPLAGTVSCERYGNTEWTISVGTNGLFQARVPIDAELVARDAAGRELRRHLLQYEPAYAFCHYLPDRHQSMAAALEGFIEIVREMTWEFPIGYQPAASYVRTALEGDAMFEGARIHTAPRPLPTKRGAEIVMLLLDKTRAQPGDRIGYAAIFRVPPGRDLEQELIVEWGGYNPGFPRVYSRMATIFEEDRFTEELVELGYGFYMRRGGIIVPAWAGNTSARGAALRMTAWVRGAGEEIASLLIPIGETKRELLVSTTWDGLPATWGEGGIGPCDFSRQNTYQVRYPDYRNISLALQLNGTNIHINPKLDTAAVPDADDALFLDRFYYDGQCEPEFRGIPYRDPVRAQPEEADFSGVKIHDPADETPPLAVAIEPRPGERVRSPVRFYYALSDLGLSGSGGASLLINGDPAVAQATINPVVLALEPGDYSWQIQAWDRAGNEITTEKQGFTVVSDEAEERIRLSAPFWDDAGFSFSFTSEPGARYLIERDMVPFTGWSRVIETNASAAVTTFLDPDAGGRAAIYRVRRLDPAEE